MHAQHLFAVRVPVRPSVFVYVCVRARLFVRVLVRLCLRLIATHPHIVACSTSDDQEGHKVLCLSGWVAVECSRRAFPAANAFLALRGRGLGAGDVEPSVSARRSQ